MMSTSSNSSSTVANGILKMIKPIPTEYVKADAPEMKLGEMGDVSADGEDNVSDQFNIDDETSSIVKSAKKADVMGDVMGEINNIVEKAVRAKTAEKTAQKTAQMEPDDGQLEQK